MEVYSKCDRGAWMGELNVGPQLLTATRCNANGSVGGLCMRTTTHTGQNVAESFLPLLPIGKECAKHSTKLPNAAKSSYE
jgi:hypothetical protein